jgi:hypothetical protein
MIRIFILIFFIPLFGYSQNIFTHISIARIEKTCLPKNENEYEFYKIEISPGYRDHSYKIELLSIDSTGNEVVLCNPEIKVKLIVHRNDYKRSDGRVMWDYKTEVESNDALTNDYLEIPNCSNERHLTCRLKVKSNEKYSLRIYYSTLCFYEYSIENGEAKWKQE